MHVLVLPKWWPARPDPQLGDFIRKQMLAVAAMHRVSVVYACPVPDLESRQEQHVDTGSGMWECRGYYRPSTCRFMPLRKALNFLRYRRAIRAGIGLLQKERARPELIHAHILTRPVLMAWRYARTWRIPYITSEQSSVYLDGTWGRKSGLAKALDRWLIRRATGSTAVSTHLSEAMVLQGLGTGHAVVPNVVPGMDKPLPAAGPPGHFLMVADLVDRTKNISGAIRALACAREAGHDHSLEVIGGGPDLAPLQQLANELGLAAQVRWHGRLAHAAVLPLVAQAGAVIVNSNFETFSVVTGEALALGKPVIATRCGGPEGFITPENGMLIPVGDTPALCAAMVRMAQEHARFSPEAIRASVGRRFSPEAVREGFDKVYRNALSHG